MDDRERLEGRWDRVGHVRLVEYATKWSGVQSSLRALHAAAGDGKIFPCGRELVRCVGS